MNEATLTALTWLIPVGPLLAFFVIILLLRRSPLASWLAAWIGIGAAWVLSLIVAFNVIGEYVRDLHHLEEHPTVIQSAVAWMPVGEFSNWLRMGVAVDPLTAAMLIVVPFAIAMIYVYSVGYHNFGKTPGTEPGVPNHGKQEPLFGRFFAFMALFGGAMLILVVADNLLLLFVGWEVMGLCSYLLIGFWYAREYDPDPKNAQKLPPRWAAVKAFMTTRVADVIMLIGIVWFYRVFGTLNFSEAFSVESLVTAGEVAGFGVLGAIAVLIFSGTVGKSAQFPLHVWLPNAMEGPTPVSAVIHAAAMVSAGVYLILRIFPLVAVSLEGAPTVGLIIAGIGAFTALMAATIAVAQDDVKGVLAYSTISQLGFMVAAVGLGAYVAAAFHLLTHAFFKALLFLGSGSVIHGMEHGAEHVHDHHTDPQDMMNMGGLRKKMPSTFWTFLIGGMALSGFPVITAGFWSKDEIFADAYTVVWLGDGKAIGLIVFIVLALAAFLTAFYTMRQISLTFLGEPRTPLAEHAHESNGYMVWPLYLLSIPAVAAGWIGIPDDFLGTEGVFYNNFHHFVGATLYESFNELYKLDLVAHKIQAPTFNWVPLITSVVVAGGGLLLGYLVYGRKPLKANEPDPLLKPLGPLHNFLRNKWYWDELYAAVFIRPTVFFSEVVVFEWIDRGVIDGTLHLIARVFWTIGAWSKRLEEFLFNTVVDGLKDIFLSVSRESRYIQTGKIQEYALVSTVIAGALTFLIIILAQVYG